MVDGDTVMLPLIVPARMSETNDTYRLHVPRELVHKIE
jgi:hypothetical protein